MIMDLQLCARKVGKYSSYQRFISPTVTLTLVFKLNVSIMYVATELN